MEWSDLSCASLPPTELKLTITAGLQFIGWLKDRWVAVMTQSEIRGPYLPIPPLNEYKLLPVGAHECTLDEIESRFVYTSGREQIWRRFIEYLNLIKDFTEIKAVYVDGSFVTDIKVPSDLDIAIEFVSFYDWGRLKRAKPELFDEDLIKRKWLLDCLPCAPEIMSWQTDYRVFFQDLSAQDIEKLGIPKGTKKGILVVRSLGEE